MIPIFLLLCLLPAFFFWRKEKYTYSIAIIVFIGFLLRLWCAADPMLHAWDERYHALVAKNLGDHFLKPTLYENPVLPYDHKSWASNHIWLHKQPLALWLIAISIKVLGNTILAVRLPSVLLSTLCILLTYDIVQKWYNKQVAVISAFLFSINGLLIELATGRTNTDHIDTCFIAFILLAIWLMVYALKTGKFYFHFLIGLCMGLAILTKWLPALIVLPVWMILFIPGSKRQDRGWLLPLFTIVVVAALVSLPWQYYIQAQYPAEALWEGEYNKMHFFHALEDHKGPWYYHLEVLRISYGELVYIPVAWFSYRTIKRKQKYDLALSAWLWIPLLFFTVAATKMPAYTSITAPAIFIMTALFFRETGCWIKEYPRYRLILRLTAAALLLLPVRYAVERIKPFADHTDDLQDYAEMLSFKDKIDVNGKTVVFNAPRAIEWMYHYNCTAYEHIPDVQTIDSLKSNGYKVLILD